MERSQLLETSDHELMLAVRDGDLDKLGDLFERYNKQLYNFFLRQTKNPQTSEDMVQEAFMRILKYRHTYRGEGKFTTWMFSIAHNAMIDFFRRTKRRSDTVTATDMPEGYEPASEQLNPEEQTVRTSQHELLHKALDRLPENKREALLLSRFQNMKYSEIAQVMGCKTGTVKARIHFAIKELTEIFGELNSGKTP
jgi:RNA polymerase sigma-70 factor (ECF subfamily)